MILPMSSRFYDLLYNEDLFPLYYDDEKGIFEQDGGWVVHDLHTYITPHELIVFLERKQDMLIQNNRHGFLIALMYPCDEYEYTDGTFID